MSRKIPDSERPQRLCRCCGKSFSIRDRRQLFCSAKCVGHYASMKSWHVGRVEKACRVCGTLFVSKASERRTCCSSKCRSVARNKKRPPCAICGKPVKKMVNKYCSKACQHIGITKPEPHSYTALYERARNAHPEPKPCARCGNPGKHRHHPNYEKPEEIEWLCVSCHKKEHTHGLAHGRVALPISGKKVTDGRRGKKTPTVRGS